MSDKAALYLRLSKDDGTNTDSDSILNQRSFLYSFCEKEGITVFSEYTDDGFSGLDFERPGFKNMMVDAFDKKFNIIITKDMSRLGRDYIKVGEYIEKIFPLNGIRYIAVNDGVDTAQDSGINDMIPLRAVFNDMYAKDISKKVKTALNIKRLSGSFIGSSAPFGYIKDEKNKGKLLPDARCDFVVKRIYEEFVSGKSMLCIAKTLTSERIPTPSQMKSDNRHKTDKWNSVMIKRILTNPTYMGNLTQGFFVKVNYKTKKRVKRESLFIVKNTHMAIVSDEMFDKVSQILKKREKNKTP